MTDQKTKKILKDIADNLMWCAFWLFFISIGTCSDNTRIRNEPIQVEIVSDTTKGQ